MSNSLIPVRSPAGFMASKPPTTTCAQHIKIKYKPIFKPRNVPIVVLAEVEPEPNKYKAAPAVCSPVASRRHIGTENGYAMPKREQLTSAPRLRIVSEPELGVQKSTPTTYLPVPSKANLGKYNPVGYIMSAGLVQKATSVSTSPKAKLDDINVNAVPKCEQLMCGSHPQITSELEPTAQKITPISQSVDSSEVDFDNDNDKDLGNPTPEEEQMASTPCVAVKDESQYVVPKTPELCPSDQSMLAIESEDSVKDTFSGGVIFADESPKEKNIAIGRALDTPHLDSGNGGEKLENKKAGSDLEALDEKREEAQEMHDPEQMDYLQEAPLPIRKILKPTARNCAAVFHQKTLAAWSALNLAIGQAIQILHSNPAAGPATPQMVVDFLGSAIVGHAIVRENLDPKAIRATIENLLLEYHQHKAEKAKDSARVLQQLELGFEIKDLHMLDYGMDDAVGAPESFIMEGVEATTGHSYFSRDLDSLVFHEAARASFVSTLASPEGDVSEELVDYESIGDCSDISDEVMEESKNSTAMVLRMLEYGDTDDEGNSEISQPTRSHSPEFTAGMESSCGDSGIIMEVDETDDLPGIEELSLITDICMNEAPDTVVSSDNAGPEDIQHLSITAAGDFAMAERVEGVDDFATTDTDNMIKGENIRYSDGIKEFADFGSACSTKEPDGTGTIRNIGENNSPDIIKELNGTSDILMSEEEEKNKDPSNTFHTKEVVDLSFLSGVSTADSEEHIDIIGAVMAEKSEVNEDLDTADMINHPSPAEEVDSLDCIGLADPKGLYDIEEILVTKEIDTNDSFYIEEFDDTGPPFSIEGFEGPEIMSEPGGFDVTIDLDATIVGAVGITTAQIYNVIIMDDEFLDGTQTTVNGTVTSNIGSSVEDFDGVGAAEFAQLPNLSPIFASTDLPHKEIDGSIGGPKSIDGAMAVSEVSCGIGGASRGVRIIALESEDLTQELGGSSTEDTLETSFSSDEECSNISWEGLYDRNNNPVSDHSDVNEQIDITRIQGGEMGDYLCLTENVRGRNSNDDKISHIADLGSIEETPKGKHISSTEEVDEVSSLELVEGLCQEATVIELEQLNSTTRSVGLCSRSELEWYSGTEEYSENQDQEEENDIRYDDFARGIDDLDERSADKDIDWWVINWLEGLPSEVENLEEVRKEEEERERVIAGNIKDLSPIWASCEGKQKSWEGFPRNQAPALAVEKAPMQPVIAILLKDTATPTTGRRKYIWGLIFCFICISALVAASNPSLVFNRLRVYTQILGLPGIQSGISILRFIRQATDIFPDVIGTQEISLLVFIQISTRWRSRETVETNISRVVLEIIGLAWAAISCIAVGLGVIYTSSMDLVNALRFASVQSQPAVSLQVSKPQPRNSIMWEDIVEVKRDNSTDDGVEMNLRLHEELWKELVVNEVAPSLLLRLEGPVMAGFPLPIPDEVSPRYILGVGSGVSTKHSGAGVADVGVGTLGLGLMSLLMFGGGRRRQLRRGGRRLL